MQRTVTYQARGLYLGANEIGETPEGAMKVADNVVVRRDGVTETRRGFTSVATKAISRLFPFRGAQVGHSGGSTLSRSTDLGATWTDYGEPINAQDDYPVRAFEFVRNLYLSADDGVKRIDGITSEPEAAGVPSALDVQLAASTAGSPTALPTAAQVAYRMVFGKKDSHGRLLLGAPSGRSVIANSSGSTVDVTVTGTMPAGLDASHFCRIYRTRASASASTDPGDEVGLVYESALPVSRSVSSLARATGVVTATTATDHGYQAGQLVYLTPGGALVGHDVVLGTTCQRSTDNGATWSSAGVTLPAGTYYAVASSGALYVAVGASVCATSADGLTWTSRTIPAGTYRAVVWTGARWVAVGDAGVGAYSTDGATWTGMTVGTANSNWKAAVWSGSRLVAVGSTSAYVDAPDAATVAYSSTGTSWTGPIDLVRMVKTGAGDEIVLTTVATCNGLLGVTWTGARFVAVGRFGGNHAVRYSTDGSTWSEATVATVAGELRAVAWNGTIAVALGTGGQQQSSADGVTWTAAAHTGEFNAVGWDSVAFVAVGVSVAQTSSDGASWTARTIAAGTYYAANSGGGAVFSSGEKTIASVPTSDTFTYAEAGTDGTLTQAMTAVPMNVAVTDTTPDGFIGAALYSNANQEGILYSNERPPKCADLAAFQETAYYANVTMPASGRAYLLSVGAPNGVQADDTVTINGLVFTAKATETASAREFKVYSTGTVSENIRDTAASLARVVNRTAAAGVTVKDVSDPDGVPGHLAFTSIDYVSSVTVVFSRARAWSPAAGIDEAPKTFKNGIARSKRGQPDHVPTINVLMPELLGSDDKAILRVVATRSSIFAIKEDGIWRDTGDGFIPFDPTVRVIAPESVAVLQNTVFALAEQGVVQISDVGVALVSRQPGFCDIEPALRPLLAPSMRAVTSTYAHGVAYESEGEYRLALPTLATDSQATQAYRFSMLTRSWTRDTLTTSHAMVDPADGRLYLADGAHVYRERKDFADTDYQDAGGAAISTDVTWAPRFGAGPGSLTEFQEVALMFSDVGFATATLGFATNLVAAEQTITVNGSDYGVDSTSGKAIVRSWPPRDMTIGSELDVTWRHSVAGKPNAIAALVVTFDTASPEARR